MGPDPVATIDARTSRNARITRTAAWAHKKLIAVVIECVDNTCTVVGGDCVSSCRSLRDAMKAVEQIALNVVWRETTPGYWVARAGKDRSGHS